MKVTIENASEIKYIDRQYFFKNTPISSRDIDPPAKGFYIINEDGVEHRIDTDYRIHLYSGNTRMEYSPLRNHSIHGYREFLESQGFGIIPAFTN